MKPQEKGKILLLVLFALPMLFTSCKREQSGTTGWEYNNPKNGGFQKIPYLMKILDYLVYLYLVKGFRNVYLLQQFLHY